MSTERFPQYTRTKHVTRITTGDHFPLKSGKLEPKVEITILTTGQKIVVPRGIGYAYIAPDANGTDHSFVHFTVHGKKFTFLVATDGQAAAAYEATNMYFNLVEESKQVVVAAWTDQKTRENLRKNVNTHVKGLSVGSINQLGSLTYYFKYRTKLPSGELFSASVTFSQFYPDTSAVKGYGMLVRLKDLIESQSIQTKAEARALRKALEIGTILSYDLPLPEGFAANIAANAKYRLGR